MDKLNMEIMCNIMAEVATDIGLDSASTFSKSYVVHTNTKYEVIFAYTYHRESMSIKIVDEFNEIAFFYPQVRFQETKCWKWYDEKDGFVEVVYVSDIVSVVKSYINEER